MRIWSGWRDWRWNRAGGSESSSNVYSRANSRNTHFSYTLGVAGVEQFVSTPELHSDEVIESDPLPPGQVWAVSMGSPETGVGLYRLEVTSGPGSGVKILNQPVPPAFRESVRIGEQNLYTRAKELVGDRDSREHEFSIQMLSPCGFGVGIEGGLVDDVLGHDPKTGSRFTWVKMGYPSIEGLRLALLDGTLSVKRSDQKTDDPNDHGALVIEDVTIAEARYMSRSSGGNAAEVETPPSISEDQPSSY